MEARIGNRNDLPCLRIGVAANFNVSTSTLGMSGLALIAGFLSEQRQDFTVPLLTFCKIARSSLGTGSIALSSHNLIAGGARVDHLLGSVIIRNFFTVDSLSRIGRRYHRDINAFIIGVLLQHVPDRSPLLGVPDSRLKRRQ